MPLGPGKYDDLCTAAREQAKAEGVVLIVIGGERGSGFSVQADLATTMLALPGLLERIAAEIRESGPFMSEPSGPFVPQHPAWPKPVCPACGSKIFNQGPRGGLSTNIECTGCGKWWNYTPVLPELQPIDR